MFHYSNELYDVMLYSVIKYFIQKFDSILTAAAFLPIFSFIYDVTTTFSQIKR